MRHCLGADAPLASTLSGYVDGSPKTSEPDLQLVKSLAVSVDIPVVVGGGRYQSPREAAVVIEVGANAVVVGSAITRPQVITEKVLLRS